MMILICVLATFFNVSMYILTLMGIPWIFNIIKGNISNKIGKMKLKTGDNK